MLLILIIIIILYLLFLKVNIFKENYQNYRSITIQPNKYLYKPPKIICKNIIINNHIVFSIQKYYPYKIMYQKNDQDILNRINNNINELGITTFYDYYYYINNYPNNNIRFICNLFDLNLTIIGKNDDNFNNKTVCIENKNTGIEYVLKRIKNHLKLTIVVYGSSFNKNNVVNILNKYDNIAYFTNHPDTLTKYLIDNRYYFKNINMNIINNFIPNYKKGFIDTTIYNYKNIMINSLRNDYIIICNKNLDSDISYSLLNLIYTNFINIKQTNDTQLKKNLQYFNLSDIFAPPIDEILLHSGIMSFYKDKGYITNLDRNICRKYVGIKKCDNNSVRLNPYRIL